MPTHNLTVWLPEYTLVQHFLRIIDGRSFSEYQSMWKDITAQSGTKQNTVNWKDPDSWIPDRLTDESFEFALHLWQGSGKLINPRWSYHIWQFVHSYRLTIVEDDNIIRSSYGDLFIGSDEPMTMEIDAREGVLVLLKEIADKGPGTRRDFIDTYTRLCKQNTAWTENSIANSVSARLKNLTDRGLITRKGHTYQISDSGLVYLNRCGGTDNGLAPTVELLVNEKNTRARQDLAEYLQSMNPIKFEHLIKRLLEEMGYEDVEVTSPTNDKGVDVVAEIEVGVSRVREVIQVKRVKGNIGRPTLDQLRGSLPFFDAVRGTIVSTGGFSKPAKDVAFFQGAAPITLIDGDTLVSLLIEHDIGVRRREIRILEFDSESLSEF